MSTTVDINEVHKENFRLCQVMAQHLFDSYKNSGGFQFSGTMVARAAATSIRDFLLRDDEINFEVKVQALQSSILSTPVIHLSHIHSGISHNVLKEYGLGAKGEMEKSINRSFVLFQKWAESLISELTPILQDVVNSQSPEPTPPKSRRTP